MGLREWVGAVIVGFGAVTVAAAEPEVRYRVEFEATWSAESHPDGYTAAAHFSPPVGAVHGAGVEFWRDGGLASSGIEFMAETGATSPLIAEIDAAALAGLASPDPILAEFTYSPGVTATTFTATPTLDRVSYVSMLAPSPDWFVGTNALRLRPFGRWLDDVTVVLDPFDAGTDSGVDFLSPNADTVPQEPIAPIVTPPLGDGSGAAAVGRFTFAILTVDGLAPYGDADGDGLTNLREAELGTDAGVADTDADGVADPLDRCPVVADPGQADADGDLVGDACDVCPARRDRSQVDADGDGQGDACDLDDGILRFDAQPGDGVAWQSDPSFDAFNLYRGDLALLRAGGAYTQDPADPRAARWCGLLDTGHEDGFVPAGGTAAFYLVAGVVGGVEGSLGADSSGVPRPNEHACP